MSFRTVFITLAAIALVVAIGTGFFLWYTGRSGRGLTITFEAPEEVAVGVPFVLRVLVANESSSVLEDARLLIEVSEGVVFLGSDEDKDFREEEVRW